MADFRWNEGAGRFADSAGRFVAEARVRAVIDAMADAASDRMAVASERLLAGEMSLGAWQAEMQATIKLAHSGAAVIAHGGAEQMTAARWGAIGPVVRDQYAFLRDFAAQITDGRQPLNRTVVSRAEMYGQSARGHFERVKGESMQARGYRSCRNVLHANESCGSCRAQSSRGWVEIGTLVPIGARTCLSRCRCSVVYRREPADEVQAA